MMTTMMNVGLAGVAVLGAATLLNLVLGRASASLRHLVWAAAVGALVALPIAEASGVRFEVPIPGWYASEVSVDEPAWSSGSVVHEAALDTDGWSAPAARSVETGPRAESSTAAFEAHASDVVATAPPEVGTASVDRAPRRTSALRGSSPVPAGPVGWNVLLTMTWALGAALLLLHTALGHRAALRIASSGAPVSNPRVRPRIASLARRMGLRRTIDLRVSDEVRVPATWGFARSTIVLPPDYETWPDDRLHRVLLHELAHVARRDGWTHLLGDVARAIHWPNPLAWVAAYRLRIESERACDDRVLDGGETASDYADDLVGIARGLKRSVPLPDPMLAMAGGGGIAARIAAILDPERERSRPGPRTIAMAALLAAGLTLSVTGFTPVAQERPATPEPPAEPVPVAVAEADVDAAPSPEPLAEPAPVPAAGPVPTPESPEPRPELSAPSTAEPVPTWEVSPPLEEEPRPLLRQAVGWATTALATLQPRQSRELCIQRGDDDMSTSSQTNNDHIRVRWETDDCRLEIEIEGDVDFSADDRRVTSMGRNALLEIEERDGRTSRRVRMEEVRGDIERRYWVDGDDVPWGAEADAWVALVLPELFRRTTLNAEPRVRRMLAEGGPSRVFQETEVMRSEHVVRRYLELLMEHGDLSEREYVRVIDRGARFESDHNQASLLMHVIEVAGLRPAFQDPLLDAARNIESDHQMAMVLTALLQAELSSDQLDEVVRTAQALESDHQLAMVLSEVARQGRMSDAGRASFVETLETIESDHQYAMVLETFLDNGSLTDAQLNQVLGMTRGIESDHQRARILQRIASEYPLSSGQVSAFLASAREIESDHQLGATAMVIMELSDDLSADHGEVVLAIAAAIDSDHQRATVLHRLLEVTRLSDAVYMDVLEVAEGIGSDHQLALVLNGLVEHGGDLSRPVITELLGVAGQIGSDHQQASVLVRIAGELGIDASHEDRIRSLAARLSDHQERQVLEALGRRARI